MTRQSKIEKKLLASAKEGKFSRVLRLYPNEIRKLEKDGLRIRILEESQNKHSGPNTTTVAVSWDHINVDSVLIQNYSCGKIFTFPNLATRLSVIARAA